MKEYIDCFAKVATHAMLYFYHPICRFKDLSCCEARLCEEIKWLILDNEFSEMMFQYFRLECLFEELLLKRALERRHAEPIENFVEGDFRLECWQPYGNGLEENYRYESMVNHFKEEVIGQSFTKVKEFILIFGN